MTDDIGWGTPPQLASFANVGSALSPVNGEILSDPIPKASQRLRLSSIADIKRQMRLVYIEARNGDLATAEASRYIWMLGQISTLIADAELEERVERLEGKARLMAKRVALKARLKRLEQQRQPHRRLGHRIVFSMAGKHDDEITGFDDNKNLLCIRQAGEPFQTFTDRAFAATGAHCIYASYSAHGAATERDGDAEWHSSPASA